MHPLRRLILFAMGCGLSYIAGPARAESVAGFLQRPEYMQTAYIAGFYDGFFNIRFPEESGSFKEQAGSCLKRLGGSININNAFKAYVSRYPEMYVQDTHLALVAWMRAVCK